MAGVSVNYPVSKFCADQGNPLTIWGQHNTSEPRFYYLY